MPNANGTASTGMSKYTRPGTLSPRPINHIAFALIAFYGPDAGPAYRGGLWHAAGGVEMLSAEEATWVRRCASKHAGARRRRAQAVGARRSHRRVTRALRKAPFDTFRTPSGPTRSSLLAVAPWCWPRQRLISKGVGYGSCRLC